MDKNPALTLRIIVENAMCFLDAQGELTCLATGMKYDDVNIDEDDVKLVRTNVGCPRVPSSTETATSEFESGDCSEVTANVAPGHVSAAQALCKAAGPTFESLQC